MSTVILRGLDDLAHRRANGLPLMLHGRPVTEAEAAALLAGRPIPPAPPPPPPLRQLAEDEILARRACCEDCSHLRPTADRCGLMPCGCSLAQRQGSPLAYCPDGRWPARSAHAVPTAESPHAVSGAEDGT